MAPETVLDILKGVLTALVTSLLVAVLFAFTFRFPIPLAGMIGPFGSMDGHSFGFFGTVIAVCVAWVVYGFFGGFVVLPLVGGGAGFLAGYFFQGSPRKNRLVILCSAIASVVPVVFLATLDLIAGPW